MLKRLIMTTAMSLAALSSAWAEDKLPVTGKTCSELLTFYKSLPFTSILPLPDGPVSIPGKTGDITVGFSQTGFNHPWRTAMLAALQAEACRHPNIQIVVVDGNVDVAKQNNDVRDLLARGFFVSDQPLGSRELETADQVVALLEMADQGLDVVAVPLGLQENFLLGLVQFLDVGLDVFDHGAPIREQFAKR